MSLFGFCGRRNGKGGLMVEMSVYSKGHEIKGGPLQITSLRYNYEEAWRKTALKVFYLSRS
jgi:hypothetical protein